MLIKLNERQIFFFNPFSPRPKRFCFHLCFFSSKLFQLFGEIDNNCGISTGLNNQSSLTCPTSHRLRIVCASCASLTVKVAETPFCWGWRHLFNERGHWKVWHASAVTWKNWKPTADIWKYKQEHRSEHKLRLAEFIWWGETCRSCPRSILITKQDCNGTARHGMARHGTAVSWCRGSLCVDGLMQLSLIKADWANGNSA